MKTRLWIVLLVVVAWTSFLIGYSLSALTGARPAAEVTGAGGDRGAAEGSRPKAGGYGGAAEGSRAKAGGYGGAAEGSRAKAGGYGGAAEGSRARAGGYGKRAAPDSED